MEKVKDIAQHVVEYLLVLAFSLAAYGELAYEETTGMGLLGIFLPDGIVTVFYAIWFVGMAVTLFVAKVGRMNDLRKHTLLAMYLTTVYTVSLAMATIGWDGVTAIDDGVIGLLAAAAWLRLKLKLDYIKIDEIDKIEENDQKLA